MEEQPLEGRAKRTLRTRDEQLQFERGQCVIASCGGPTMTVIEDPLDRLVSFGEQLVHTMWFDRQGHLNTGWFQPEALRHAKSL
jgi:uncharacterized protein YodC (DUF2158 family)